MQSRQKKKNLDLIPVILMMALLPLAAKGEKVNVTLGKYAWLSIRRIMRQCIC